MRGAREQYLADLHADELHEIEQYAPDPRDAYPDQWELDEMDAEDRARHTKQEWSQ